MGAPAPGFCLKDQFGRPVDLHRARAERPVLLVFFPLAFTAVCEAELAEIRDRSPQYPADRVTVLTVSVGPPPVHRVWAASMDVSFPILSDFWPHGAVARSYGVFDERHGTANRGTFLVDRDGIIRFAEMTAPGEPRDQEVWVRALAQGDATN